MNRHHAPLIDVLWRTLPTPDGPFTLAVDHDGFVLASGWTDSAHAVLARVRAPINDARECPPSAGHDGAASSTRAGLESATRAVREFYDGDVHAPGHVPVRLIGTAFQQAGWRTLRAIAPGAPLTYTQFAARMDRPNAVRAAASVCAKNAAALFVPCHRVLPSGGGVGQFAWGADVKQALTTREHETVTRP